MLARLRSRRPSHATVVAYLALFVALGGTSAYAINEWTGANIVDESLTGADVKGKPRTTTTAAVNGSLTTDDIAGQQARAATGTPFIDGTLTQWDIKNGSVTGSDVLESSLGKVPDADKLDGLDSTQVSPVTGDGRTADLALDPFASRLVLSASITTVRNGALAVSAAVHVTNTGFDAGGADCYLKFDGTAQSPNFSTYGDVIYGDTLPVVWVQGVAAGSHSVQLYCTGYDTFYVNDAGMIVSAHM